MSDRKNIGLTRERRLVPESAICYVGDSFATTQAGHEFIVIAKDEHALRFAWSMLGPDTPLDFAACPKLAAFEYKATK